MAVSAFKSTTKRSCDIGLGGEDDVPTVAAPFQPSTPLNKPRYRLRRSRSVSNFSSGYFSDSAPTSGDANSRRLDSLFQQGKASGQRQSEESESDADSMYSRHTYRSRQLANFGLSRKAALDAGKSKRKSSGIDLTRSSSNLDGGYKEISDFLSCLGDESDPESPWSPARISGRSGGSTKESTDSVFSRLTNPDRYSRTDDRRLRASQNGQGKATGTRAKDLRRSTSHANLSGALLLKLDYQSETDSSYSRPSHRSRDTCGRAESSGRFSNRNRTYCETEIPSPDGLRGLGNDGAMRDSFDPVTTSCSSVHGGVQTASHQDESPFSEEAFFDVALSLSPRTDDTHSSHPEEEKTIRAVHTQTKGPLAEDADAMSFYDVMRVEMMKAVSEIRSEIEQKSSSKELVMASSCLSNDHESSGQRVDGDSTSTVAEVRQEYDTKLEQSEKRAQDLWNQLAAEERRCEDLVQYVKELLASQADPDGKPRPSLPPQVRPSMDPDVDRELVSDSLNADAQRYFDECVSLSGLEVMSTHGGSSCGVGTEEIGSPAWSVKDLSLSPRKKDYGRAIQKKIEVLRPLVTFCAHFDRNGKCSGQSSISRETSEPNSDGIVLPWLQWETDLESSQSNTAGRGLFSGLRDSSRHSKALNRSQSLTWRNSRSKSNEDADLTSLALSGVSGLGCVGPADLSCWKGVEFGFLSNLETRQSLPRGSGDGPFDVDMFVLQRSWLAGRISSGSVVICGGMQL